jgi:hypothetical protein
MENVMIISWNHCAAICLVFKPLMFSGLRDEVLSPLKKIVAPHLCIVEGVMFKNLRGTSTK